MRVEGRATAKFRWTMMFGDLLGAVQSRQSGLAGNFEPITTAASIFPGIIAKPFSVQGRSGHKTQSILAHLGPLKGRDSVINARPLVYNYPLQS